MMPVLPAGYSWDHRLHLGRETAALSERVWPRFLTDAPDLPEPGLRVEITPRELAERFPVWGIRRDSTGELVAFANAAQVTVDGKKQLPESGWQFAVRSGTAFGEKNALCLLVANVDPSARGLGLSKALIERAKLAGRLLGLETMVAPVRPTKKHELPAASMEEYLKSFGALDPWIGVHAKSGASISGVCPESVVVRATLTKWRDWTGCQFTTSGKEIVPGALAPVDVDVERNLGTYREPNVWMKYSL